MKINKLCPIIGVWVFTLLWLSQTVIIQAQSPVETQNSYLDPVTKMEFIRVKGGCYQMGNTFGRDHKDEKPVHRVCLNDYYVGKFEVTRGVFKQFVSETGYRTEAEKEENCFGMDKTDKWGLVPGMNWKQPGFLQTDSHPVVCITWNDTQAFVSWLNKQSDGGFRLLTEAEWEYAARSGGKKLEFATQTGKLTGKLGNFGAKKCCNPDDIDNHWFTAPVGSYPANNIGVFDLSGNVWEWISDWYDENYYQTSPEYNPKGPENGSLRIIRGGSWSIPKRFSRCSNRRKASSSGRHINTGFRIAKDF